ncbi:helix-turn-helix domain-containing protein [Kitasatospora kifunensis]|uniref:Excisionase family DNA binding protein n=1 Tax=Kitasatospora kifunensis TaxID=58351 RepID=A0A7W7VY53_KITKI|nr:helix-turn-helix domain-containing protein [Kitasatospora kifunensis]MBB4926683.1 excisionase family DNA binding protein [Kitasatospora kifunensis]
MAPQMYSVDQVAVLLGLHVRTVRAYIRDGRLKAVRIGKQYRIAAQDLEAFTGQPAAAVGVAAGSPAVDSPAVGSLVAGSPAAVEGPEVEVSSIVRIDGIDATAMDRISTMLLAAVAGRPDQVHLQVQTVRNEERRSMKIIVLGGAEDSAELLRLVGALAGSF